MVEAVMAYGGCGWRLRKPNAPLCLLLNHTHPWLWWWRGDGVGVMVERWRRGDEGGVATVEEGGVVAAVECSDEVVMRVADLWCGSGGGWPESGRKI
ncbi:hypothetical protein Tco_1086604, partial [Tanacetum coccineum]